MDNRLASVYGLKDTRNGEIFYVGMSREPYARYGQHLSFITAKDAKEDRILDMRKEGIMPELVIFEQNIPLKNVWERETYWVQHYIDLGIQLTNINKMNIKKKEKNAKRETVILCDNDTPPPGWIYAHHVVRILWPFKDKDMPDCVKNFAYKRFIKRYRNKRGTPIFCKQDILLYRNILREKGDLPN